MRVYKLRGTVQSYSWGGRQFIPELLGQKSSDQPAAEYWLGAHPNSPSEIDGSPLDDFIAAKTAETLGNDIAGRYGNLPFLFKILDVKEMLSIQVHPTKPVAIEGFERENALDIPLNASNRNYKDKNHKPEQMVALGEFWLLHGFKSPEQLKQTLENTPELVSLVQVFENGNYRKLFQHVMEMPEVEVRRLLEPLLARVIQQYEQQSLTRESPDFWAARAALTYCSDKHIDRGIFSIYFLNLVHLRKGEGIYQPSGMLHAYLEGQNVELMANSDNVLRAGLTTKHIDVDELLRNTQWESTTPVIIRENNQHIYETPAEEFSLKHLIVTSVVDHESSGPEIALVMNGSVDVIDGDSSMRLNRGEALYILPDTKVSFHSHDAEIFCAFKPQKQQ